MMRWCNFGECFEECCQHPLPPWSARFLRYDGDIIYVPGTVRRQRVVWWRRKNKKLLLQIQSDGLTATSVDSGLTLPRSKILPPDSLDQSKRQYDCVRNSGLPGWPQQKIPIWSWSGLSIQPVWDLELNNFALLSWCWAAGISFWKLNGVIRLHSDEWGNRVASSWGRKSSSHVHSISFNYRSSAQDGFVVIEVTGGIFWNSLKHWPRFSR